MPIRSLKILATLASSLILALWLMQHNIEQYWQQTYYRQSPLAVLQNNALWRSGDALKQALGRLLGAGGHHTASIPVPVATAAAKTVAPAPQPAPADDTPWQHRHPIAANTYLPAGQDWTHSTIQRVPRFNSDDNPASGDTALTLDPDEHPIDLSETETVAAEETPPADAAAVAPEPAGKTPIQLGENDRVLLIGDSMMQSLAPHIQRELLARHHIKSINRGKPSSGLRFPGYYNWPENLGTLLDENPDVRLIVVMLGANDPQNTPNPAAPKENLHFGTPEWETYYRGEIRKILATAAAHNVKTLWIGPPVMKSPKYSNKISYLDSLIADEVGKAEQHYQNTNRLFAKSDGSYTAYLPDESGKPVAVRKSDGIHFTTQGEKILTRHILARINP